MIFKYKTYLQFLLYYSKNIDNIGCSREEQIVSRTLKLKGVFQVSNVISEGKTKRILSTSNPEVVLIESKDDITAGDGAKHDIIIGKAALATRTNANVFRLLRECGLPVAFIKMVDETHFLAKKCQMVPYEVVVRRQAQGSFLKRHPELSAGHIFPQLLVEFFLKTSEKKWQGISIPVDDPYIQFDNQTAKLYSPKVPLYSQEPFLVLNDFSKIDTNLIHKMGRIAYKTFLILEKSWQLLGMSLADFKVEFGVDADGQLLLADVIDNDSWRVIDNGKFIDKQLYRDGADLNEVTQTYQMVTNLTDKFGIPRQQIIFWKGSNGDDTSRLSNYLNGYNIQSSGFSNKTVVCSVHKEPIRAYETLNQLVYETPDSVIISYIGRSNGAGPILSAMTSNPVITIPATWEDFPDDVWSSLRTPSNVPVATILNYNNAIQAALQILALRNPEIYAILHLDLESRLVNFSKI